MRLRARVFAVTLACPILTGLAGLAGLAAADDWEEFQPPDHSFTVHFPVQPTIETASYRTPDGRSFGARVYSAKQETGEFRLTVVEVPETGSQTQEDALMADAVKRLTEGGQVKFDIQHRVRWNYGRQLAVAGATGGYAYIAVFHHHNRLYQVEGKAFAAGGQAEVDAMRFQQSLDFP